MERQKKRVMLFPKKELNYWSNFTHGELVTYKKADKWECSIKKQRWVLLSEAKGNDKYRKTNSRDRLK